MHFGTYAWINDVQSIVEKALSGGQFPQSLRRRIQTRRKKNEKEEYARWHGPS
jgi:hypothetical protein